jgi:tetratricopeptide (TPR) repeat protein
MVVWRCFIACGFISFLTIGCGDLAISSTENTKQVVQESNVTQLLTEVKDSQKAENLLHQGNSFLDTNRYKEALSFYDQAIAIKTDSAEIWVNRGNALTALHRYEEALESYEKAIAVRPNRNEAWYNRGNALTALQRYPDAVKAYDEAIAIHANKYEAWINRGIALTKLQRYKEALASYNQAISIKPNLHQAYYNKACNYALQGNIGLTIENLEKAIQLLPDKYKKMAGTDTDFDKIRDDKRFQVLLK